MQELLESKLHRAAIRAMPGNPAGRRVGVRTGLWYVPVYRRRGPCVENEDYVYTAGSDLTWDDAYELSGKLNRQFAGEE
jgi:hypothetical protein